MIGALPGPWLIVAALLLVAVVARRCPRPAGWEIWLVGAIFACAAVPRLLWGIWGPLHVNGQGPLWIRGALDAQALVGYGPGYFELFAWVGRLGVPPDRAIFAANALLSALSPALLYATARLAGVARGGALAVAVVLAADAVIVHTAASEWYASSLIALVLGVQASLALAVRAELRGDSLATGLALAAAGLLGAAAARIHPIAYLPLGLSPLVALGAARPKGWRARLAGAAAAAAAIGGLVLLSSGTTIIRVLRESAVAGHAFGDVQSGDVKMLVVLLAAIWCLRRWIAPPWLPLLGVASLLLMFATEGAFRQSPLWNLCYMRVFFPGVLLGAAALLPARLQGFGWALGTAAVAAVVLLSQAWPRLGAATTEQLEYRFLQQVLADAPPDCTVAAVTRAGKRVWEIPSYLVPTPGSRGPGMQRGVESPSDLEASDAGGCLMYVRSSLCASSEGRQLCESVERGSGLERVASRVLPAVPSYLELPYDGPEVEVVVFRAPGQERGTATPAAVSDGAAISPDFAQFLYDRLAPLRESDGCRLVRFDTARFRITLGLQGSSPSEQRMEIAASADAPAGHRVGAWVLVVPEQLERECGATLAALERVLSKTDTPAAPDDGIAAKLAVLSGSFMLIALATVYVLSRRRTDPPPSQH